MAPAQDRRLAYTTAPELASSKTKSPRSSLGSFDLPVLGMLASVVGGNLVLQEETQLFARQIAIFVGSSRPSRMFRKHCLKTL